MKYNKYNKARFNIGTTYDIFIFVDIQIQTLTIKFKM